MLLHHGHEHGGVSDDKTATLLGYMYNHNVEHTKELDDIAEALREEGRDDSAEAVEEAKALYEEANELLHDAIHAL